MRILDRMYSCSRSPYARRRTTRISLLSPSTHPRDLVLWLPVGSDLIPLSINHLCELLVGLKSLPLVDAKKPELRIRCVVRPDREQAILA